MGLDKAIKSGKEHRKEYRGAKAVDPTCRNHGSCPWCIGTRTNKNKAKDKAAKEAINNGAKEIKLGEVVSIEELESYLPNSEYEAATMDMYFDD